ncbi:M3 family oligoendopeptidase [Tuberibacillus calidus]|uniref:M3 family oligoendopeptidase n=1 Tax=Tuberibacillus calidus TaxID=340097 RepID=UPI0004146AB3|nr:M3 family oligoendopeptidase [Tuberibacillus calidus]
MKFNEYKYERPDMEAFKKQFQDVLTQFTQADSFEAQDRAMGEINRLRNHFESMQTLAEIRHSIDTTDEFYETEQNYFDENGPIYQGLVTDFYKALVNAAFRKELEEKWGSQLFNIAELRLKTFSPEIIEDLQQENKLSTEYTKLMASAKIEFDGKELNLSQLGPYQLSTDRDVRRKAYAAKYGFMEENEEKLDDIYDQLVKVRTTIARKLGYKNFVELGYARMMRTDYNADMVKKFRDQVKEYLVPVASKLKEKQRRRLGIDSIKHYDDKFSFKTGNAKPKGDSDWILENGKRMYQEMSAETHEFFTFMTENGLMDLVAKKGKAGGGYCTYISEYQAPFIFSNFNGTVGDIDVLTHEVGHAFQAYSSRHLEVPEYAFPTYEAAEIHSMSMEFFAWPWMDLFFKEDADKYRFGHLSEAILFIPYGVAVDEFQHFVYEHPDATPAERKAAWREIEKKYLPHLDYSENDYLERGGYWHQQGHIFGAPFYYIDYTLAQICALSFWKKMHENREAAWNDYLALCREGGSRSFTELIRIAHLRSPFEEGCVEEVIGDAESYLDAVDDTRL